MRPDSTEKPSTQKKTEEPSTRRQKTEHPDSGAVGPNDASSHPDRSLWETGAGRVIAPPKNAQPDKDGGS